MTAHVFKERKGGGREREGERERERGRRREGRREERRGEEKEGKKGKGRRRKQSHVHTGLQVVTGESIFRSHISLQVEDFTAAHKVIYN